MHSAAVCQLEATGICNSREKLIITFYYSFCLLKKNNFCKNIVQSFLPVHMDQLMNSTIRESPPQFENRTMAHVYVRSIIVLQQCGKM